MKYGNLTLGQIEAGINKIGGEDAFMRLLAGELNVVPAKPTDPKRLLELVTTASVAAIESFKSSENFKEGKKGPVQIYSIGDNFKKHFGRKEEGASEAIELKIHKLLERSLDAPIITELADKFEITLGQFFSLIQKQGKGEAGVLLTNGYANIAYIRDDEGILWAVRAGWDAGSGWYVEASSVGDPFRWVDGGLVLSR